MRSRVPALAVASVVLAALSAQGARSARQAAVSSAVIDVVAVDRDGRPVDDLGLPEFSVTVDGQPRGIVSVTHVSRGAGAESNAMSRQENGGGATAFAAEPSRVVLVVVDQTMLARGDERAAIQAATAFLDRLGLDDRIAVVRLPMTASARIATTTDRPAIREALAAVLGQATQASATAAAEDKARPDTPDRATVADPDRVAGGDPDKTVTGAERAQPQPSVAANAAGADDDVDKLRATLSGLSGVLEGFQSVPGRKVVALFSPGLSSVSRSVTPQIDALATAAAAARTVIHAFRLRVARLGSDQLAPDFLPMETLAKKTGGSAVILEKDPARAVDLVVQQLSACYVLKIEGAVLGDRRPHAVRVETTRKGVTLRTPSALVVRSDPEDRVVAERPLDPPAALPVGKRESPREIETEMALSRMTAYVLGYQRAFSGLVAEELYSQQLKGRDARTRSDFLLVKVETADYWVSFRDVFEVDGKPVRDREERLKRLFLDNPTAEALAQVEKIKQESARLNVGPVERNINVPLFPLTILLPDNRPRFRFTLADKTSSNGVPVWKIEYEERVRPTMIRNRTDEDVPAKGYFLVDPLTGAIVETVLDGRETSVTVHLVVHYRHDAGLGLWVPGDMTEMYMTRPQQTLIMGGKATYSNFRRFQVKTEEKVAIPK